jgi:hypothetical protein
MNADNHGAPAMAQRKTVSVTAAKYVMRWDRRRPGGTRLAGEDAGGPSARMEPGADA